MGNRDGAVGVVPSQPTQFVGVVMCPCSGVTQCGSAVIAGTDEGAIIEVVTKRSNAQRQQILKAYKAHYGRVLQPPSHPASSCPLPHGDQPLTERNPAQGAVGSWGIPTCPGMTPPRETELSQSSSFAPFLQQPPTLGAHQPKSLPLRLPHPQLHTEDSRARISPEPPEYVTLNCPKSFHRCLQSLRSPPLFFLSCCLN